MNLLLFGHRGAAGEAPENTLEGFEYAFMKAGVRCFELDVRLTSDKHLVVMHDADTVRTTGYASKVGDLTLQEIRCLNANRNFADIYPKGSVPALSEVLSLYSSHIHQFQVEIKQDDKEKMELIASMVTAELAAYGISEKTVVTSFEPYALECVSKLNKKQKTGLIASPYTKESLQMAFEIGCFNTCIPIDCENGHEYVSEARRAGLQVTGWLGNLCEDIDKLLSWKVDSITTNFPARIHEYLKTMRVGKVI